MIKLGKNQERRIGLLGKIGKIVYHLSMEFL